VVDKVGGTLTVSKQKIHRFHTKRFSFKKLNEVEGEQQYLVEMCKRFASVENLDAGVDVRAYQTIRENLNLGLVHPVAPVFNENHKSITFVRNLSCLYCTQYHTTCFGYTSIFKF
jgi:hypothetical protein